MNKEYFAFISYSHKDKVWAKWLQHELEYYKLPTNLNGRTDLPKEIRPVFRDATDLNGGLLEESIQEALDSSVYLIVICSPNAAQSSYVNEEVKYFKDLGRMTKIIPFIIDGKPHAKIAGDECFPMELLNLPVELLGINIHNENGKYFAAVQVVARMFGLDTNTLYNRYKKEQERKRKWAFAGIVVFALASLCVAGWIWKQNMELKAKDWELMEKQSRMVAEKANRLVEEGDALTAQKLLLDVLPENIDKGDKPCPPEAEFAFRNALLSGSTIFHDMKDIDFNPNGENAITLYGGSHLNAPMNDIDNQINQVFLWDLHNGQCDTLKGHTEKILTAYFSPDGRHVVSTTSNTVRIWEVESRQCIDVIEGRSFLVARFYSDNKRIVTVSSSSKRNSSIVRVWDISIDGRYIQTKEFPLNAAERTDFSISSDGTKVARKNDSSIILLDVVTGISDTIANKKSIDHFSFSNNSKKIVIRDKDELLVWDIEAGRFTDSIFFSDCSPRINDLIIDINDSNTELVKEKDINPMLCERAFCVDNASKNLVRYIDIPSEIDPIWDITFSPDGKHFAIEVLSGVLDRAFRDFNIYYQSVKSKEDGFSFELKCSASFQHQKCFTAAFNPKGSLCVTSSPDTIKIWNMGNGNLINTINRKNHTVSPAMYSVDGENMAYSDGNYVYLCDSLGNAKDTITYKSEVHFFTFGENNKTILSTTLDDKWIRVWDYRNKIACDSILIDSILIDSVKTVLVGDYVYQSKNEKQLVIVGGNGLGGKSVSRIGWSNKLGNRLFLQEPIRKIAWSRNKKLLSFAVGDGCYTILLSNWEQRPEVHVKFTINSISYSPDERLLLISVEESSNLFIYDTETNKFLANIQTNIFINGFLHDVFDMWDGVHIVGAAFNPTGDRILVIYKDGMIRALDFPKLQDLVTQTRKHFNGIIASN